RTTHTATEDDDDFQRQLSRLTSDERNALKKISRTGYEQISDNDPQHLAVVKAKTRFLDVEPKRNMFADYHVSERWQKRLREWARTIESSNGYLSGPESELSDAIVRMAFLSPFGRRVLAQTVAQNAESTCLSHLSRIANWVLTNPLQKGTFLVMLDLADGRRQEVRAETWREFALDAYVKEGAWHVALINTGQDTDVVRLIRRTPRRIVSSEDFLREYPDHDDEEFRLFSLYLGMAKVRDRERHLIALLDNPPSIPPTSILH
ncbi:MAG: hypothetical protein ACRDKI_12485, partial [Solirubrobacterales bacterium]